VQLETRSILGARELVEGAARCEPRYT